MTPLFRRLAALWAAACGMGAAHVAQAQTGYAIAGNGATLVRFDLATPGATTFVGNLSGATTFLNDIDFRASDGLLYGYSQPTNQIVTINTATAVTTFLSNSAIPITTNFAAIDFNPVASLLRIASPNGQNVRIDPATGAGSAGGTYVYAAGDANAGITPFISDVAFTNNTNPSASTTIYYIDSNLHALVSSSDPNNGVLDTIGSLGATSNNSGGFDIYTDANGLNSAYALLDDGANTGLYSINLGTGATALIGNVNASGGFFGFAIDPSTSPAAVPEPGSITLLVGFAVVGAGFLGRRRKTA